MSKKNSLYDMRDELQPSGSTNGTHTASTADKDRKRMRRSAYIKMVAMVGIIGAGVFSAAVLLYALRLIPRFDLTDINRF